ncbi:ATP-dependent helicase [Fuchsiella alkaliacetigena]|uniref:ATP-dependent helicase n=1 Tax=Fuchsiella alkaliacetigena TaxID=957042 RepID=UPI00200A98CF|nr:ATP-dependent helicase [Fuchsiella alkaliacetigena]MCK8825661.1 ATP-dependent helicase [Fuchsiella alkaliacetigena]
MIKLRPGQKEVAQYRQGMMAVPAVPGAGKTTVLAYLAAELIAEGHSQPGKILIVTYMNSAVSNFRTRIGEFLEARGENANRGYEIKTLHSLAVSILRERPDYLLINQEFQILDQYQQGEIISELTQKWLTENRDRWEPLITVEDSDYWQNKAVEDWTTKHFPSLVRNMIATIKSRGLSTAEVEELPAELPEDSYLPWVCEIYSEYMQILHNQGCLDFDDLILQAFRLLKEDQELRQRLQTKWSYIFEDEAQDSNPLQEEILHLLAGQGGNLVRVGDSNQAIMGTFTAAEPELFRNFCKRKEVQKESILYSSRSTEQIIDLANYLVQWVRNEHPQPECRDALAEQLINPVGEDDPAPNPVIDEYRLAAEEFNSQQEELAKVAYYAAHHIEHNPENTAAILVPNRYAKADLIAELENLSAPFEELSGLGEEEQRTIDSLRLAIEALAQPQRTKKMGRLLKEVFLREFSAVELEVVDILLAELKLEELLYPLGDQLSTTRLPEELLKSQELFTEFKQALEKLRLWLEASLELAPDKLVLFLAEELNLEEDTLALAQGIALQIRDELKLNSHWRLLDIVEELPRLEPSFRNFVKNLHKTRGFEAQSGVITVLTAHKAKGLEWDTVYLTSLTSWEHPSTLADKFRGENWYLKEQRCNPEALAKAELDYCLERQVGTNPLQAAKLANIKERLRLLYVAITRAKKNLFLSSYSAKRTEPSRSFQALAEFIEREREEYVS